MRRTKLHCLLALGLDRVDRPDLLRTGELRTLDGVGANAAHAHNGITESYVCLSGAVSENHQGVYTPGSMIFNPPEQMHRITVSDVDPALLAYAWIAPPDILISNTMEFGKSK